ncbi:MAG: endonuclease III [Terriglobia bacterium]
MPIENRPKRKESGSLHVRVKQILTKLKKEYPDVRCALEHQNPFQLLVATILSAQCTDVRVNQVTPALFRKYSTVQAFASALPSELEKMIHSTGFFRNKAKNIIAASQKIVNLYDGQVPRNMEHLLSLPGVARKTANVVLGTAFGIESGVVVDTHVFRLTHRLGLTGAKTPEKVEIDLMKSIPRKEWIGFSHYLIHHGRKICFARKPSCNQCALEQLCPKIGVQKA